MADYHFGLGYLIPIKETSLAIELIYTQGIINQSSTANDIPNFNRLKTSGLRFQLAWTLPLKKEYQKDD